MSGVLVAGINTAVRLPVIFAGMNVSLMLGEIVLRTVTTGLGVIGFNGNASYLQSLTKKIPAVAMNVMRPFEDLNAKQLAVSLLVCATMATVGWEVCNVVIGKPPGIYNTLNLWVSPMRLNTSWRHPVIQVFVDWLNKKPETE